MEHRLFRKDMVLHYLEKYPGIFTEEEIFEIIHSSSNSSLNSWKVREILDELHLISPENNIYNDFLNLLMSEFKIERKHIIEVGGGAIPCLGKRIVSMQTTGKITIYDPRLSIYIKDTDKLKLVRKRFSYDTDIGDAKLLIGLMPCEGADALIESALRHRVDFMVWLCEGGPHGEEFDYFEDGEEWRHSIISSTTSRVLENNMGKLKVKYLKKYGFFPIIYNKR